MPIVEDVAIRIVIFAYNTRHIPNPENMSLGVRPNDLLGDFALIGQRSRDMDRGLGPGVGNCAPHRSKSLCRESCRKHFFTDAIGRKTFSIDINRNLLLLYAIGTKVRDRFDTAQTIAQFIHVSF